MSYLRFPYGSKISSLLRLAQELTNAMVKKEAIPPIQIVVPHWQFAPFVPSSPPPHSLEICPLSPY